MEISFFVHATEDTDKCMIAVKNIIPSHLQSEITFVEETLQGHHDNPITVFKTTVRKETLATDLVRYFFSKLEEFDKELVFSDMESRIDDRGNLYIRLDKQEAYSGNTRLGQMDPIHIKIRIRGKFRNDIRNVIRGQKS